MRIRTSITDPLQIAEVAAPSGGTVGITFCPGKRQTRSMYSEGGWKRDLGLDLAAIKAWGAGVLITLITHAELKTLQVEGLGEAARALGLTWLHLPITDVSTPTVEWERAWAAERAAVRAELARGGKVVVHCKGGLGRAGTVAGVILVEAGMDAEAALAAISSVRPGAPETSTQKAYVRAHARRATAHGTTEG